ncbi:bifunctional phosphoglucose/phosphomannose isomerase [Patescibacteria group bacterium]|nr:bifunctional phosphoglucose/phosphomannose isomerase [Patescibacteria group bacterium]
MSFLDNIKQIQKLDKSNMSDFIADLPEKCLEAYTLAQKIVLPQDYEDANIENVVICGMGGSAIGGELAENIIADQLEKSIIVIRDWNPPKMINKNSLVFLVSYSGNTKEILSCAEITLQAKAKIFIITQGGELKKFAQKNKLPIFSFQYKAPPRASLSYLLMPVLVVLEKSKLVNLKKLQIPHNLKILKDFNQLFYPQTPNEKNIAKHLAYFVFDHLPIIIAPTSLSGVARRWKTQFAENGKNFSFFNTEPEIFHNFVESRFPQRLKDDFVFLILENLKKQTKSKKSLREFEKLLEKQCIYWQKIPQFGKNIFTQILSLVLLGDWISFYLAILNQVDPTPIQQIEAIKRGSKNERV